MIYLVDTNVLLRSIQQAHPMHADAKRAAATLTRQDQQLSIVAQNLIEFWAVATRPAVNNGLALSINDTAQHVAIFKRIFTLLADTPDIFPEWERLVDQHKVSGRQVHDARLVAAMKVHSVTHLLTFNTDDFKRYDKITVVNPQNIT
jgi:predicted nucleic acid-binding protein